MTVVVVVVEFIYASVSLFGGVAAGRGRAAELLQYAYMEEEPRGSGSVGNQSPWRILPEDFVALITMGRAGSKHIVNSLHAGIEDTEPSPWPQRC